jgi:cyclophilin family peptidyl-prolyl cis-trans isomerase
MLVLSVFTGLCAAGNPQVTLQITGAVNGSIVIELYPQEAPVTVANFVDYVQNGFYDGLIFHRVIRNFMIQGGGFDTDLVQRTTNPEIINESFNRLSNVRGTIAMARTSNADSATSQFFINQVDNYYLDYGYVGYDNNYIPPKQLPSQIGYCVFGKVTLGMDVVDAIAVVSTTNNLPDIDVIIQSATVTLNEPVCADKLEGDINGDCRVDFADFVKLAENWLLCNAINTVCN